MEPIGMGAALEALDAAMAREVGGFELPVEREYRVRVLPNGYGWSIHLDWEPCGDLAARLAGALDAATASRIVLKGGATAADMLVNFRDGKSGEVIA